MFRIPSVLAFALLCSSLVVRADADEIAVDQVRVGFNSVYKVGSWTPIFVSLDAAPPPDVVLEIQCPDPDGNTTTTRSTTKVDGTTLYGEFRVGRLDSSIRIRVVDADGQVLVEKTVRTTDSDNPEDIPAAIDLRAHLVMAVGPAQGFAQLDADKVPAKLNSLFSDGHHSVRFVSVEDAEQLPVGENGLAAADVIILSANFDLPDNRIERLENWIRTGGHLIVATGKNVQAFVDSPVAELLSNIVTVDPKHISTSELSSLESYSGRSSSILLDSVGGKAPVAKVTRYSGEVLKGREGSLMVESGFGFGKVSFLALEVNEAPLSEWESLPALCHRLIFGKRYKQVDQSQGSRVGQLSQTGVSDLSTQLISTQGDFGGVDRASSWIVMGMLLLYVLLIGPVDYFIVHKILRRPHLTWFTFPLLVAAGAAVAITSANERNGDELKLNQLEIIDLNPANGNVTRGRSIFTVYSPTTCRLQTDVAVDWNANQTTARTSWGGVPEDVFGGMYRSGGVSLSKAPYSFSDDNHSIDNLPINTWSTQRLSSEWQGNSSIDIDSELTSSSIGILSGSFSHNLPVTIDRWVLGYGNRVYRPVERKTDPKSSQLPPGRRWSPGSSRDLKSFLTGMRVRSVESSNAGGQEIVNEQTDYDRLNNDPEYVLRMLTFHRMAGGTQYTGLRNDMYRKMDLTALLKLDYAVLVGSIDKPAARLSLNGDAVEPTGYDGFVRIVIPVKRVSSDGEGFLDFEEKKRQEEQRKEREKEKAADNADSNSPKSGSPDSDDADSNTDKPAPDAQNTDDKADAQPKEQP